LRAPWRVGLVSSISPAFRFLATMRSDKHMASMDWIGPENAA
jgi:hypothetical protein